MLHDDDSYNEILIYWSLWNNLVSVDYIGSSEWVKEGVISDTAIIITWSLDH